MNENKIAEAIKVISAEIMKLPAGIEMDYGTAGHTQRKTVREGKAHSMSLYIVQRLTGVKITGALRENMSDDEKNAIDLANQITQKIFEICAK